MAKVNTLYKTKDWSDIIGSPDLPDQSEITNYLQNCSEAERKRLSRLLGNNYDNPTIKTISTYNLKPPPFHDRFDYGISDEEFENLDKIPIEVVRLPDGIYMIVRNRRYYEAGRRKGIQEFNCVIIGEVKYEYEAYIPRLSHVLTDHKPFHVLEKARCISECKKYIFPKYGVENLFEKGGDRRSKDFKKYSLIEILKTELPLKRYQIEVLNRLSDNIGLDGIEALYQLLNANGEKLSIYRVHKMNPKMRRMMLRTQIKDKIEVMEADKKNADEIKEAIAIMIFDVLFERTDSTNKETSSDDGEEDNDDEGKDDDDESDQGSDTEEEKGAHAKPLQAPIIFHPIKRKDLSKIKKLYKTFIKSVKDADDFWRPKKSLSVEDSEESFKEIDNVQTAFTEFIQSYMKAINGY